MKNARTCVCGLALASLLATAANAALNFSFTGNFTYDNDVQQFTFAVGASSPNVILRTYSYAGGVNAAGQSIARGGFDPILAVFNSAGTLVGQNDDGGYPLVPLDAVTGMPWDTYLDIGSLAAGTYTATIMQYNNFAHGPALGNGFVHDGPADRNFTRSLVGQPSGYFWDVSDHQRDSHWAFDILNVEQASAVPEPSTYIAGALTLLPLGWSTIRRVRKTREG